MRIYPAIIGILILALGVLYLYAKNLSAKNEALLKELSSANTALSIQNALIKQNELDLKAYKATQQRQIKDIEAKYRLALEQKTPPKNTALNNTPQPAKSQPPLSSTSKLKTSESKECQALKDELATTKRELAKIEALRDVFFQPQ